MASSALLDLNSLSLGLCVLLGTYTTYLSGRPPNPTPYDSKTPDSFQHAVSPRSLFIRSFIDVFFGISHALLCLTYPTLPPLFCPHPSNLNNSLFTWTPYSIASITFILVGSLIRLYAFAGLGKNFTFRLAPPKKLVTSGLYQYVQHPSYTGKFLAVLGEFMLLFRVDATLGCWLPSWIVEAKWVWRVLAAFMTFRVHRIGQRRVADEEDMLKKTFGKEWEEWNAKTKRFIPWVY